jgi:hypothetical protein
MGFESSERKMRTYMSLGSTKSNDNKVTAKFFVVNKKNNNGQYEKLPMVDQNNYPKPFYGFLTKVTPILDNMITKSDGSRIPSPKVNFEFTDDCGEVFILDLPFLSQDKKISTYIFGFVNSLGWLAANGKLGYIKLYIAQSIDKTETKRFNLGLRCATNWTSGSKDYGIYNNDSTKVDWKYKDTKKDIPSFEVTKKVDGEMVTIDNRKKQQDFFLKEMELISEAIKTATYDIGENKSASMNTNINTTQIFDEDGDDTDDSADFEMTPPVQETKATKTTAKATPVPATVDEDDDDLPF